MIYIYICINIDLSLSIHVFRGHCSKQMGQPAYKSGNNAISIYTNLGCAKREKFSILVPPLF